MNIAFDIDGVLTDFEWFIDTYGRKYFTKKFKTKVKTVKFSSSVAERFGYSQKYEKKFYARYLFWYARKYPIRENAAEVIRTLRLSGHKIYFVTSRALAEHDDLLGNLMRRCLKNWLRKNRVEYDGIYFVSHHNSARQKAQICKKLHIDIFVEDEPANIEQLCNICKVICLSADYNEGIQNCFHVVDFGEVFWNIIKRKDDTFAILDYKERESLEHTRKEEYYKRLRQYYLELPFDYHYLEQCKKSIQKAVRRLRKILCRTLRIEVSGQIPDSCGGVIFVCNHRRALDVPICYCVLNNVKARILTKREFEDSILGSWMKALGIIFLKREDKKSGKAAQNLMIQTVLRGENVLLFPEGTRNRTAQTLLPFKMGAVYMAQVTQAPIVPLVINKSRGRYRIVVGQVFKVGVKDDLEVKNRDLQRKMEKIYCNNKF